jgi:hypothetical protein
MTQSRAPTSPVPFPSPRVGDLRERARRTRWLAGMSTDATVRTNLVGYADELDRRANAVDHSDVDASATPNIGAASLDGQREAR